MKKIIILGVVIIIFTVGWFYYGDTLSSLVSKTDAAPRPVNDFEGVYYSLALAIGSPELCYKIFPKAYSRGENGDSYIRSECFLAFVKDKKMSNLCEEVAKGNGERYTKENCLKKITPGPAHQITMGVASLPSAKIEVFKKMGYDEKFAKEKVYEAPTNIDDYINFIHSKDFTERIKKLPSFDH